MKLSKLKLWNYRCFGSEEQVILIDQLTTFIGNNSAGKTAALSALNCMFSENSNDRILHRSDFHLPKDILPDEMEQQSLYIEAVFEFEELQSGSNGGEYAIPIFFQHFVVDNPGRLPYLRIRLEATWEKSNTIDGSIDSKISYITCPEFAEIEEGNRTNASRRDLDKIRVIYVPAVRDPSKQLKNASGTMMYQIMSSINWSEETKGNVKAKIKELNEQFEEEKGVSMFGTSLGKQWKTYDSDERYSTASLRFNSADIETSIRKTEVVFEPTETGKEYTIDQMGDGLRSLFYISLVDSILDVEGQMVREILLKISNGVEPHDICILCKQKPQDYASAIIEELEKHGVRARIETGYQDLIKEPIVDLFIKFMICADSRKHPNEWTFIEELLVELWGISGMRENDTFDEMQRKLSAVVNVVKKNIQQKLDTEQWHSTLNSIIDFFGIGNIKAKFPAYKQGTYFMNVINQFESLFFEEYVAAHGVWNLAIENFRGDHSVPIMTIHKSKGLEYNAVYFIGLEDSAFWNFRNQPDEDRCTFFVALSRAKASVTFTFCKKRTGMKCPMQRHNAINEFFDLLQRPGIAEVKRFQNR